MQEDSQSQPHKWSWVNFLSICLISLVLIAISPFFEQKTQNIEAVSIQPSFFIEEDYCSPLLPSFQENSLFAISEPFITEVEEPINEAGNPSKKIEVVVTAYSSTPCQTDDTPYITAAGTWVRNGIVAANFLPFGTKIKIPEIYNDEIFVVEDRMHPRSRYHVDIWFPSYWEALDFGTKRTYIEILEG